MPLAGGEIFAGYSILRLLGAGGMGEVYLAQHPRLPRRDALKILPAEMSDNTDFRQRFNREADLAATLYHPHIVGVHDRGEFDGQLWISMDYIDGTDAGRLLGDRYPAGMPRREVVEIVFALASALDYAHRSGLLHRDVKPANTLITKPAYGDKRILLADFGIARSLNDISGLTQTNVAVGTVLYAAPEQLMGESLDGRADQYALAVTAYQLLTGSPPFEHSNPVVVVGHHLNATPPTLASRRAELAALDPAVAVALAKDPRDRFTTCTDFAHALARGDDDLGASQPRMARASATATTASVSRGNPLTSPLPTAQPFSPARNTGGPSQKISIAILAILILAAVVFVVRPWHQEGNGTTTSSPTSTAPAITFDGMRDFVAGYFSDLPARPENAWAKKTSSRTQNKSAPREFLDFWAKINSVTVVSVSPRDETSVVARLRYIRNDGSSKTEDAWLRMVLVDGAMLLDESGLIGPVDESSSPNADPFPYQPLWPFASEEEAHRWLEEDAPSGESPWHADAPATALKFTQNFLGFTEIDRVTAVTIEGDEAWVDIGQPDPNGASVTVATIHLARFGSAPDAPWEVVGTRDDGFTLETPRYGSAVGPIIEAGGKINGVDECIALQVRQSSQQGLLGEFSCLMAGGAPDGMPWSAQVAVAGAQPGVLTLVAKIGGHYAGVEQFAITGLRWE